MFWKKFLTQVRDKKTLGIDTIFPVLLILVGLALATISFFKDGPPRDMTPFLYGDKLNMIYNQESALMNTGLSNLPQLQAFMTDDWQALNSTSISLESTVPITLKTVTTAPFVDTDLFSQLTQLDNALYDMVNPDSGDPHAPIRGQIYINSLNDAIAIQGQQGYSAVALVNSTSQEIPAAYGAFVHTAFLRHYLEANSLLTGTEFKLKFTNHPYPISQALESLNKTIAGTNSAILMTVAWLMISDSLLQNIIKERQKNIKH